MIFYTKVMSYVLLLLKNPTLQFSNNTCHALKGKTQASMLLQIIKILLLTQQSLHYMIRGKKRKLKKIVNKIMNRQMITNLVKELDKNNLLRDFLFSLQAMSNGDIPITNIPHLAHLETMRFHRLPDSRCMWYSKKMKKFWHCFYKVGGGPPLRLLSGPKGIGINNCETSSCSINFAVPSTNTIQTYDQSDSAKVIPPQHFSSYY